MALMETSHGDMLFMAYKLQETEPVEEPSVAIPSQDVVSSGGPSAQALTKPLNDLSKVQEDPVDAFWRAKDGKIARGRDATMCRHGGKGMCDYCMPLEVGLACRVLCVGGADGL
jgi:nuclear protein localization family protein 4